MKRLLAALVLGCFITFGAGMPCSYAGEIDLLVQKLVEKGILTAGEAQLIITETKEEVKKEIAQAKNETLPLWLQTFKLKGDMRVRYQHEQKKGANNNIRGGGGANVTNRNSIARDRARFRLRVGGEAKVFEQSKVYFGLASGSDGDPRSTNQTFQDQFAKKAVWIDYAYADYKPFSWATFQAGRMKNPLWEPGDILWDTDINPEGGAVILNRMLIPGLEGFINSAVFMLGENSNGSDPWMFVFQPGVSYSFNENNKIKVAGSYYNFQQLQGYIPAWPAAADRSNNRRPGGFEYGFDSVSPSLELSFKNPLKQLGLQMPPVLSFLDVPFVSLFGEYLHNMEAPYSKTGYLAGIRLGAEKVANKGDWQARYMYVMLGTQAWPDFLPDSDRYTGGRTGIRSHEATFSYGLGKGWSLDLDYYLSRLTAPSVTAGTTEAIRRAENLVQVDLNWKF